MQSEGPAPPNKPTKIRMRIRNCAARLPVGRGRDNCRTRPIPMRPGHWQLIPVPSCSRLLINCTDVSFASRSISAQRRPWYGGFASRFALFILVRLLPIRPSVGRERPVSHPRSRLSRDAPPTCYASPRDWVPRAANRAPRDAEPIADDDATARAHSLACS